MRSVGRFLWLIAGFAALAPAALTAQGVTTGAIQVFVTDAQGQPRLAARVVARHEPSGTRYESRTQADGRAVIPGMRVGGPYTVTAAAIGFEPASEEGVEVRLGGTTTLMLELRESAVVLGAVRVTAEQDAIFSTGRTGAATTVNRQALDRLPTITGRIEDFTRLTPQYKPSGFGFSFAGQDNRLNNVTVDGAYFNNSFGLAGQPGDRTNVAPISLAAVEQVQVNVAPYDVRQGNFVGAGVNTVTRSGTNEVTGTIYYSFRDGGRSLHGRRAGEATVDPGEFDFKKFGLGVGGPIIRDRLFFYTNYESDELAQPGTTFLANTGQPVGGNVTRVLASDLDQLSNFLSTNFGYDTGPYVGYKHQTPATRFIGKLDFNVSDRSKLMLRYVHLDSDTDVLISNSGSLGGPNNPANRRTNTNALNFRNSNYKILENIRSIVGEWNTMVGERASNSLIAGYTHHDESRESLGQMFPLVDINRDGNVYTSFGFEPFTPNNELRYSSFQLQNNYTIYGVKHDLTFGASLERYESENVFFPGSQSVYVYNSLEDWYRDANDFIDRCGGNSATWSTCSRATSPDTLRRFQVRWANQPGMVKPVQPLRVWYAGVYAQDQWQAAPHLRITAGLRLDVPRFGATGFANNNADGLLFRDENGQTVVYETGKLPSPNVLFSPRLGFNWDARGDRSTQVRGGTGLFSGRPAYVWISNQVGNTGVLTGFQELNNITNRPFHPDPNHYKPHPSTITGGPASSYGLELTDKNFKFPQLWRNNIAVDHRLPYGLIGTAEFIHNRDVNGIYYIDANMRQAPTRFVGADNRERWCNQNAPNCPTGAPAGSNAFRLQQNQHVSRAVVLKNQNDGRSWVGALSLEKPFSGGSYLKAAYAYGESKNTVDPGSIATGSFTGNAHSGDPNNPGLGFSSNSPGHRAFVAGSYRREYFRFGATTLSLVIDAYTIGNQSYLFAGDANGDGAGNDLIYVHRDQSEMNFQQYTATVAGQPVTFTAAEQAAAWDAYISQDPYLSTRRGRYAERNAVFLPMVKRADFAITQEVFGDVVGRRNALQLRADFLNVGNLINKNWGISQRLVHNQPLTNPGVDAQGRMTYRLRNIGGVLMDKSFEKTAGLSDVFRIQLGVRYLFN